MVTIKHEKEDRELGRIIGGLAWPAGDNPAFAVIVGEDLYPRLGDKVRHCYLLSEVEESDLERLFERCVYLLEHLRSAGTKVEAFFGREHHSNMRFLDLWCRDKRKELPFFYAPNSDDGLIGYHIDILRKRARNMTLHLFEGCKLRSYIEEVGRNEVTKATDSEYPAVAALGYAVTRLTEFDPDEEQEEVEDYPFEGSGRSPVTGY